MRAVTMLLLSASFGCPSSATSPEVDPWNRLEPLGATEVSVPPGMSATLQVRYLDELDRPARGTVLFTLQGERGGAALQDDSAEADGDGVAEVELTAGQDEAEFQVIASANFAQPVEWTVRVALDGTGNLLVRPDPDGNHLFEAVDVALYEGVGCSDLDARSRPRADLLQSAGSVRDDVRFEALAAGSQWTVLVVVLDAAGNPVAFGCVEEATVEAGTEVVVEVPIEDLSAMVEGAVSLESHFFLFDGLPADVRADLAAAELIADDPDYPGTDLLDRMEDQVDDDIVRWAFEASRFLSGLDMTVDDMILDWSPDMVPGLIGAGGALAELLEDVRVDSTLTFESTEDPDEEAVHDDDDPAADEAQDAPTITASHELVAIVLELDGMVHRFAANRDVGVTGEEAEDVAITLESENEIDIARHELGIDFGVLARYAMQEIVLAQLPGRPRSLSDYMVELVPCDWVGDEVAWQVGMGSAGYWANICELAAGAMGDDLEARMMRMDGRWDTLRLEGTAQVESADDATDFDALEDGEWTANLVGPAGGVPIEATFEGERAAGRPLD